MFSEKVIKLAKPLVEAIKKISKGKWEWEPEVGEHFIGKEGIPIVIAGIIDVPLVYGTENRRLQYLNVGKVKEVFVKNTIPLLYWERIVETLEGMGHKVTVTYDTEEEPSERAYCNVWRESKYVVEDKRGKDCQSAVMRAVIALAKEVR